MKSALNVPILVFLACCTGALTAGAQAPSALVISEFKAVNNGPLLDDDFTFSDWIEIHNTTTQDVNTAGWFLTDWAGNLRQWMFPSTNIPPRGFLIVHASGRERRIPGRTLHTGFRLTGDGEYLALVEPDGVTKATEFAPYPPQSGLFSYGYQMDTNGAFRQGGPTYLQPTPGGRNGSHGSRGPALAVTEIMFHPQPPGAGSLFTADDFEFIEVKNIGTNVLNLSGITFGYGVDFTFGSYVLEPGARVVVVENRQAFTGRYGSTIPIAGVFGGSLADGGERLALLAPDASVIVDFTYSDQWARVADGLGYSLVLEDEGTPASTYGRSTTWRASSQRDGSAGRLDPPSDLPRIRINEVLTRSELPYEDAIELFNPTAADVDISGWFLTDQFAEAKKYRMPRGSVVPAGGYLALDEHAFNAANDDPTTPGFGLSDFGEEIYLVSADAAGELTGWAHGFRFGPAGANVPFIRHVISTGEEHFVAENGITFLATNAGPKVGPLVISEIHYHPPARFGGDNREDEFIKLLNITDAPVPLFDPNAPTNTWGLRGRDFTQVYYTFPTGVVLAAHSYLLVVSFNPSNTARLQDFSNRLGVVPGTPVFGPWTGELGNAGTTLDLFRPDNPQPFFTPTITMDQVGYADLAPWPTTANGTGASLQRIDNAGYGNEPTNWWAATPAPGRAGDHPPIFTEQPLDATVAYAGAASLSATAVGTPPIHYQWRFNGVDIPEATNSTLSLAHAFPEHEGQYTCVASNIAHTAVSQGAAVSLRDTNVPTLQIAFPTANPLRTASPSLSVSGTVLDDGPVPFVEMRRLGTPLHNDVHVVPADEPTLPPPPPYLGRWLTGVVLNPGFNTLTLRAIDWRSNYSTLVTNVVLYEPDSNKFGLHITGEGIVLGASHGQRLRIGRSYGLLAVPRPPNVFRHWLDWSTGLISTDPTLTFVMQPGQTFSAVFAPSAFDSVAGDYNGLFYDTNSPAHTNAGYLSLTVTRRGAYSGYVTSRGTRRPLVGRLGDDYRATNSYRITRTNTLEVRLEFTPGAASVGGVVSENRFASQVFAHRKGIPTNSVLAVYNGRYTGTMTATADSPPPRQRNASFVLRRGGTLSMTGRLPDGTVVAKDLGARSDGLAPFYMAPYGGRGSAFGWLSLTNGGANNLRGALFWTRTGPQPFNNGIEVKAQR